MANDRESYAQIAALHTNAISQGFLATLGSDFLAVMYEAIDKSCDAVLITHSCNGRVVGFVAGASSLMSIYLQMLKRPVKLLRSLAPSLIQPQKVWKMLEVLIRGTKLKSKVGSQPSTKKLPDFELLSIAVCPDQRRSGVARRLYNSLTHYAVNNQISEFKISVGAELEQAHKFYLEMGALPVTTEVLHSGPPSVIYVQRTTITAKGD